MASSGGKGSYGYVAGVDGSTGNGQEPLPLAPADAASSPAAPADAASPPVAESFTVVIRVIQAKLFRSFDKFGKMDPFCTVKFNGESLGKTKTAKQEHMHPRWDHACKAVACSPKGTDEIYFNVSEENMMRAPTFCGDATTTMAELLGEAHPTALQGLTCEAPIQEIKIFKKGEHTGNIQVQAVFLSCAASGSGTGTTKVSPDMFDSPVVRVPVSGGTAPFFILKLKQPSGDRSASYYIGKDLSRATDEVGFYEGLLRLSEQKGQGGFGPILKFMLEYAGIFSTAEKDVEAEDPLELLVMRNMFDGVKRLRLLDIKIGEATASANWKGKSRIASLRQSVVDAFTNSVVEGYRLEGFDGKPTTLLSRDPLLDVKAMGTTISMVSEESLVTVDSNDSTYKKAARVQLQTMPAAEVFVYFLDLHQEPLDPGDDELSKFRSPMEVSEIVMHETALRLVELAIGLRRIPVPQKWIGSSVALGFDSGILPARELDESELRHNVKVHIFDWGRSELNTMENHLQLSEQEQNDRNDYWRKYKEGIDRLAFEACAAYWDRFNHIGPWERVVITVSDYDSLSSDDVIGIVELPLVETAECTLPLKDDNGKPVGKATITVSITKRTYIDGSRLKEAWRIHIIRATDLPKMDVFPSKCDPYAWIVALPPEDVKGTFEQQTCVITSTCQPTWDEIFEVPTVVRPDMLNVALAEMCPALSPAFAEVYRLAMLSADSHGDGAVTELSIWRSYLDAAARDLTHSSARNSSLNATS